jgi:hypothetical protein
LATSDGFGKDPSNSRDVCDTHGERGYKLIDTMKQKYDPDFQVISKTVEDIWPWETV